MMTFLSTLVYLFFTFLQAVRWHFCQPDLLGFIFAEIFSSHYGIPFLPFLFSLLAKISVQKVCFSFVFSVFLLCVLQFVCCCLCCLYSPPRFWSCVPLCCATPAVVCVTFAPSVRLYLVFLCASWCFFEVVLLIFLYFSPLLPLWCRVSWLLLCCVAVVLVSLCVGCCVLLVCIVFVGWLFGCVAVSEILWCVASCVVGWCVSRVCSVSCCCSSVDSVLFWVVRCFAPGGVAPPGCLSCALHRPGVGSCVFALLVVLGGSWSSSAVSGASRSSSFVVLLLV